MRMSLLLSAAALLAASPAHSAELFGGVFVHDVDTFLTKSGIEDGADVQLGWRGDRIAGTPFQPQAFASINTAGETHYGAVGVSAKFGDRVYVRPGLGLAIHTGSSGNYQREDKVAFGSRVLFAPELGVGARLTDRVSVEASWVHLSHAQLFSSQNPGIDNFGLRLNLAL